MKRLAAVAMAWGLVLIAFAPMAAAYAPVVDVVPGSGPAGSAVTVIASGFEPGGIPLEAHQTDKSGPLLGTAVANGSGFAGISITIPGDAPAGAFTIYVCGSCSSEFHPEASTTFQVTTPPTTTTTTTTVAPGDSGGSEGGGSDTGGSDSGGSDSQPTETTEPTVPDPAPGEPCVIPDDAVIIDFDDWSREMGDTEDIFGTLQRATWEYGGLEYRQWDRYVMFTDPSTDETPSHLYPPRVNSIGFVADNPANGLTTVSPPNVMRLIDDTHWSYLPGQYPNDDLPPDYFGFHVGFGHFGEGMETPDELVVELAVRAMPMELPDGTILDQGAWETVSITLGPGPQPVVYCLIAYDTVPGTPHPETIYLIDILPRTADGTPVHIPVDIDDFFYGSGPASVPTPSFLLDVELPVADDVPPVTTVTTIVDIGDPPPDPSDWPFRIVFAILGVILGGGAAVLAMRD